MEGTLFRFGPAPANVAFKSSPSHHRKHVIFVGGLTDGLLAARYLQSLVPLLAERQFTLVQTLLTSSLTGWGLGSLDTDADELLLLVKHLRAEHRSQGIVLCGHSTGCQDAVRYAQRCRGDPLAAPLLGVVLQAPVSDREWLATQRATADRLAVAERLLKEGRGEEVAFRAHDMGGAAVTARRWHSLAAVGGDDDMFSSDLTMQQSQDKLRWLSGIPTLVVQSSKDEYVPPSVDCVALGTKLAKGIGPTARLAVIEGGNHSLSDNLKEAAELIAQFVASL